ncbi:pre-mRNA-processing protein 40C isoform X1 [Rhododendron vialii]|uniref:pre-mRNA-processing protein 40C isoform X1 n=2 Tax=Rhododendron vialii TaxID=182163 RepID=UPI0026603C7D|nr:pre-mRNA-processing protein 40C isoform X1 [Rhododendron vialii]XP_058183453.1 pre-mRNA-processing protein 40C isoform X1 [Rhododendron vialii]XP_058183454.1 pre-mRNA-processing protein 40C isoform X1 [Rhododendron vialii]
MASPAWFPQEMQTSASQSSVPASGSSTPTAATGPLVGARTSTSNGGTGPASSPSFSYNVFPNVGTGSGSSQLLSSSPVIESNTSSSSAFIQPPIPGMSGNNGPSFSYNIPNGVVGTPGSQQSQLSTPVAQGRKNVPPDAASLQPPVPGQPAGPNSFLAGTNAQIMLPPAPSSVASKGASTNSMSFSFNGSPRPMQSTPPTESVHNSSVDIMLETGTFPSAPSVSQSFAQPSHATSSSTTAVSSSHNLSPATLRIPTAPSFHVPPGTSGTPGTTAPPGISSSAPLPSNLTVPPPAMDSSSSALLRPIIPGTPFPSNPAMQHQAYTPYPSVPSVGAPSHGPWLPPPQLSGFPRLPFLPYPATFSGHFPLPPRGMSLPSVPLPDAQPPGVTSLGTHGGIPRISAASGPQLTAGLGMQQESPPAIDNGQNVIDVGNKDGAAVGEQVDAWTAHKTETGIVYYYNALTGESTYVKPEGFNGEPDKVTAQPTPVSWDKLAGTDWALVTTNDGKRYYHNVKTKLSSWQIPSEVTELRRKQDGDTLKEESMSVPNTNVLTEMGSAPVSLSAPALNTGGRDSTALRVSGVPGSSSALDLIKKKLQDSGAPATSSPIPTFSGPVASESNASRVVDTTVKGPQNEKSKDKLNDANGDGNMSDSSSDSEDVDSGPTKEECIIQFKEMLKERGVAPFSKWDKELPKIVFDPRFKAIPGYSARRALFDHYVRTRADEERKEKRAAQKAAMEGFKQLLEEAKEDIDHNSDYQTFKKKWGHDLRFEALERKERESLLNERIFPLKRVAEEKARAIRAAAASSFKCMLQEKADITTSSRWSKVKDSLRNDPRYKSVKHEDREIMFNEYISELKFSEEEAERAARAKQEEQEKLKERERALRKRKEREEQEVERVRSKARRKEAVETYQALLVETIKDPQASWTESKPKLEKDPQGRAANPYLDQSDLEKLFREHVKMLLERCVYEFRALLSDVITPEVAAQDTEDAKTATTSWSTAKRLLKADPRYAKMPRKERESLWQRHVEEMQRRQKKLAVDQEGGGRGGGGGGGGGGEKKYAETSRRSADYGKYRGTHD